MDAPVLVCLHGWGGDKSSFTELREALKDTKVEILTPDLPGFGAEPDPPKPWTTDDYADWTEAYIRSSVRGPFSLLGHSHGGRIALRLALRKSLPIEHLYLCAAAGIRHPRHFRRIIGLMLAKCGRVLLSVPGLRSLQGIGRKFLYKLVRVHDYEKASPVMQRTLINVSAEDVRPHLKDIAVSADIFWGTDDRMTPYSDAVVMHEAMQGSRLHSYAGVRHRVHRDRAAQIAAVIRGRMGL